MGVQRTILAALETNANSHQQTSRDSQANREKADRPTPSITPLTIANKLPYTFGLFLRDLKPVQSVFKVFEDV